jgi:hypothetical protein
VRRVKQEQQVPQEQQEQQVQQVSQVQQGKQEQQVPQVRRVLLERLVQQVQLVELERQVPQVQDYRSTGKEAGLERQDIIVATVSRITAYYTSVAALETLEHLESLVRLGVL